MGAICYQAQVHTSLLLGMWCTGFWIYGEKEKDRTLNHFTDPEAVTGSFSGCNILREGAPPVICHKLWHHGHSGDTGSTQREKDKGSWTTEMSVWSAQARENQAAAVKITLLAGNQVLALPWHSQIPWSFGQRLLPCKRKCSAARAGFDFSPQYLFGCPGS